MESILDFNCALYWLGFIWYRIPWFSAREKDADIELFCSSLEHASCREYPPLSATSLSTLECIASSI